MKKIDFHIHTVPTRSDSHFMFCMESLKQYVSVSGLDAIAITNHNVFDRSQYLAIRGAIDVIVFPGIEVNLESGHVLVVSDEENLDAFTTATTLVQRKIKNLGDKIMTDELEEIFVNLNKYLVIPHYDKKPPVRGDELERLIKYVSAGEVDSAKKFVRLIRDENRLTPVLFSDVRIRTGMSQFPTRQTYIDCGDISIGSLKACLKDRSKVALSERDGNKLFQVFDDHQQLSTGLNILLGGRSSGKTHTLNCINDVIERVKYIRQFDLVQQDDATYEKEFSKDIKRRRSRFAEEYLQEFKAVLGDVISIDLYVNDTQVNKYVSSLLKSAMEAERKDSFSKTALFDESPYTLKDDDVLNDLISSVRQLIENIEYRPIIEKHIDLKNLKSLACELIEMLWKKESVRKKKKFVNSIVKDVKERLWRRTSATHVEDVDLYQIKLDQMKVDKFEEITKFLQTEVEISKENFQGFSVITSKSPFSGAGEIKAVSGQQVAFRDPFKEYSHPYKYLLSLIANEALTPSEFYKYFVKIDYIIKNKDGVEVSGGERSEFRLLQEIKDAQNYDILLIDEPESSFDNIFLNSEVNQMIKEISMLMPVVVVTHNSTVGASIGADYLVYARKELEVTGPKYRLYSGHPTDKQLISIDGKTIGNFDVTLNSLEAGKTAYAKRRLMYETIED